VRGEWRVGEPEGEKKGKRLKRVKREGIHKHFKKGN